MDSNSHTPPAGGASAQKQVRSRFFLLLSTAHRKVRSFHPMLGQIPPSRGAPGFAGEEMPIHTGSASARSDRPANAPGPAQRCPFSGTLPNEPHSPSSPSRFTMSRALIASSSAAQTTYTRKLSRGTSPTLQRSGLPGSSATISTMQWRHRAWWWEGVLRTLSDRVGGEANVEKTVATPLPSMSQLRETVQSSVTSMVVGCCCGEMHRHPRG